MDKTDNALISALRQNARASLSDLALQLGLARGTVRARLSRLQQSGEIAGFSVILKGDLQRDPVRALMMIAIEGRGTERILRQLGGMLAVRQLYSTNGRWDVIAEIGTETLDALDETLFAIRRLDGITASETNLLLSTRKTS